MGGRRAEPVLAAGGGVIEQYAAALAEQPRDDLPPGAMRVGPGTDAVVFATSYGDGQEL